MSYMLPVRVRIRIRVRVRAACVLVATGHAIRTLAHGIIVWPVALRKACAQASVVCARQQAAALARRPIDRRPARP